MRYFKMETDKCEHSRVLSLIPLIFLTVFSSCNLDSTSGSAQQLYFEVQAVRIVVGNLREVNLTEGVCVNDTICFASRPEVSVSVARLTSSLTDDSLYVWDKLTESANNIDARGVSHKLPIVEDVSYETVGCRYYLQCRSAISHNELTQIEVLKLDTENRKDLITFYVYFWKSEFLKLNVAESSLVSNNWDDIICPKDKSRTSLR